MPTRLEEACEALDRYDYKPLIRVIRARDQKRAIELSDCVKRFATRLLQAIGPRQMKVAEVPARGRIAG